MPSPGQHQPLVPLTTGGTSGVSQLCFAFPQLFTEANTLHCVHSNPGMCLLESCRARALGPGIWQCLRQMSLTPGVLSRSEKGTSVSQPWHQLRVCGSEAALLGFPKCNPRMFRSPIALRLTAVEAQLTQAGFARAEISPCCKLCSEGEGEALGKKRAAQVTLHTGLGWDGTIPVSPISDLLRS